MSDIPRHSVTERPPASNSGKAVLFASAAAAILIFAMFAVPRLATARLIGAIRRGDVTTAKSALRWGANPNARNANNMRLLVAALDGTGDNPDRELRQRRCLIAAALLRGGADISNQDGPNTSPIWSTLGGAASAEPLAAALARQPALDSSEGVLALTAAACGREPQSIRLLVAHGADVNACRGGGYTPLMFAAIYGGPSQVQTLIDCGANVNAKTVDGRTALMYAAMDWGVLNDERDPTLRSADERRRLQSVKLLLEHGADPHAVDRVGLSALDYAKGLPAYPLVWDSDKYHRLTAPSRSVKAITEVLRAAVRK